MSTIAAIATAPHAAAGLGVVRISGAEAAEIADRVFRPARPSASLLASDGYTALYGHVFDAEGDIDDCVALRFTAPHSYTGEDVVELSCHGGRFLLARTLRAVLAAGARMAEAGEFTRRAFLNGKTDLTGAEAVMDLISAEGRLAAKTALAAHEGAVAKFMDEIKRDLLEMAATVAAFIDYPDDDVPPLPTDEMLKKLGAAEQKLARMLAQYDAGRVLREGVDTAIVGAPNVGKSTLMNRLAGVERSIVTDAAGTTRDIVEETVRLGDVTLRLADTAGIRNAEAEAEKIGIERARARMQSAALVLAVFDGARPLTGDDRVLAELAAAQTAIAVINKADLKQQTDEAFIRARFARTITVSAETGDGIEALSEAVAELTGVADLTADTPLLAGERQRACVAQALDFVREAQTALTSGLSQDAAAVSLDGALDALLRLTGERTTEAVVADIFSRFCVGK